MARNYIKIDLQANGASQAALLKQTVISIRQTYEFLQRTKDIMDHNQDGATWTDIEALFGLPAGKGQTVYDLVNGALGAMQGSFQNNDGRNLGERLG